MKFLKNYLKIKIFCNAKHIFQLKFFIVGSYRFSFINKPKCSATYLAKSVSIRERSPDATSKMSSPRARWPCPSKRPTRIMDCTTFLPVRASTFTPITESLHSFLYPRISSKLHSSGRRELLQKKKYVSLCVSSFSFDVKVLKWSRGFKSRIHRIYELS